MIRNVWLSRWAAILILLLACGLRFYQLDAQSFWNDEGNSARLSERSLRLIIEGTASDIHPPLYYLALRGWRELAGDSEFGLRSFSAFLGVSLTAITIGLGRLWFDAERYRPVPCLAAFLVAINPTLIYYSQETRMYLLLPFLATLQSWLLWRWFLAGKGEWRLPIAYILVAVAGLYTHYFYPIFLVVQNILVAFWLSGPRRAGWSTRLRQWVFMMLATIVLYSPWVPIFYRQAGGREGAAVGLAQFGRDVAEFLLFGIGNEQSLWFATGPILILVSVAGWQLGRQWLLPAGLALLPLLGLWLSGATEPAFYKFSLLALPPLLLLTGVGFVTLWRWPAGRLVGLTVVGLFTWGTVDALLNQQTDPQYARADYRGMAARVVLEGHPNAGIILNAANQWEVFTYYHDDGAPVYPLPRGAMSADTIETELRTIIGKHERIYALFWGETGRDPDRTVERNLDELAFKAVDEWYGDVRFVMYAVPPSEGALSLQAAPLPIGGLLFGEQIGLLSAQLPADPMLAGDILPVTLLWQTQKPVAKRYKIFLHLIDSAGQIVAQRDSEPGGGAALTTTWLPGESIIDRHGIFLPLALPAGTYTVRLGLYDLQDPTNRLALPDGSEWWDLQTIQVEGSG